MNTSPLPYVDEADIRPLGLYASWGARLGALLIDVLLLGVFFQIVSRVVIGAEEVQGHAAAILAFEIAAAALYFPLCHSLKGQTVGKAVVGLKVFDRASHGRLSLGRAFLRWLTAFVLWIPVIPGLLDGLSPLWNEGSNQAWHDRVARSVVLRVRGAETATQEPVRIGRMWTSPLLKAGFITGFVLGVVGIPITLIAALDRSLARGEPNDMFNIDSPAVSHEKLVFTISIGGVTLALFALAVLCGIAQLHRRGLALRMLPAGLVVGVLTGAAAIVVGALPVTRPWGFLVGGAAAVMLVTCWVRVLALLDRYRRADT